MSDDNDSASSSSSYVPTTTLLAVPDGEIASSSKDLRSHTISWIGGYPTFPSLPSGSGSVPDKVNCGHCHHAIPLLAQVYAPPEGGENDRTVYVFACHRTACQRRAGSVRAFRASVQNETYVRDVIEQREKRRREEEERVRREKELAKINPFSTSNAGALSAATGHTGNLGSSLFGGAAATSDGAFNPFSSNTSSDSTAQAAAAATSALSELSVKPQPPTNATAGPSTPSVRYGPPAPAYQPAQYITTFEEYIPRLDHPHHAERKATGVSKEQQKYLKQGASDAIDVDKTGGTGGGPAEQWERVLPKGVDEVFERFLNRLNDAEGGEEQVLRYDFGSHPLPYSSHSELYKKLFPPLSSTKGGQQTSRGGSGADEDPDSDDEEEDELARRYKPRGVVPPCPRCGGDRKFEMQLVPGMIAKLKVDNLTTLATVKKGKSSRANKEQSVEERRKELAAMLAGSSAEAPGAAEDDQDEQLLAKSKNQIGMEWGSVAVYGCGNDCVGFGEEWVGVEWEEGS